MYTCVEMFVCMYRVKYLCISVFIFILYLIYYPLSLICLETLGKLGWSGQNQVPYFTLYHIT